MEEGFVFVCIGTNRIVSDSFGPRVGDKLKNIFSEIPKIEVFGTMKKPIHLKNAMNFVNDLKKNNKPVVLIDSAIGKEENIGDTYINLGGIEIGKAFGESLYFPASINIKTVIANKKITPIWEINQIDILAASVAKKIENVIYRL